MKPKPRTELHIDVTQDQDGTLSRQLILHAATQDAVGWCNLHLKLYGEWYAFGTPVVGNNGAMLHVSPLFHVEDVIAYIEANNEGCIVEYRTLKPLSDNRELRALDADDPGSNEGE